MGGATKDNKMSPDLEEVIKEIARLVQEENSADYEFGRIVDSVIEYSLWKSWPIAGHEGSFYRSPGEWAWGVLGFRISKAYTLRRNYKEMAKFNFSEEQRTRVLAVGWGKLRYVLKIARTEEKVLEWIERIEKECMSEAGLKAEVVLALGIDVKERSKKPRAASDDVDEDLSGESDGEINLKPGQSVHDTLEEYEAADKRIRWNLVFADKSSFKAYTKALETEKKRCGQVEMSDGRALANIVTVYLATIRGDHEGGLPATLDYMIEQMEECYGVKLQVVKDAEGEDTKEQTPPPVDTPALPRFQSISDPSMDW